MTKPFPSPHEIARELGHQLREARRHHALSRATLIDRFDTPAPSTHTLATWEQGTRTISVIRLYHLCHALDTLPHEILKRTDNALALPHPANPSLTITVTPATLIASTHPKLEPLRRWAAAKYSPSPAHRRVSITAATLEP